MSIEETYKGMWSSDPDLLKSLLDAGETIIAVSGLGYGRAFFYDCEYVFQVGDYLHYIEKTMGDLLFLIPPRPLVLEPKPLEWEFQEESENNVANFRHDQWPWHFYISEDGSYWAMYFEHDPLKSGTANDVESAKAAIHEWRVNHIKSMLP